MKFTSLVAVAAFTGAASLSGPASAIIIDDFTVTQTVNSSLATVPPSGNPVSASVTGAPTSIIGGERDVNINRLSGGGIITVDINNPSASGSAAFSNDAVTNSIITLQWDGLDGSNANANLLGGLDLTTDGGISQIGVGFTAFNSDLFTNYELTIFDTNGASSSLARQVSGATTFPANINFLYADMAGGVDYMSVASISLQITGLVAFDSLIGQIATIPDPNPPPQVPEPGMLTLLGLGLAGLGIARRRRKV